MADQHPTTKDPILKTAPGWGGRLKKLREYRGLTQAQLGNKVNLGVVTISRHENGANPRESSVRQYETVLGCHGRWLLLNEGPSPLDPADEPATPQPPPNAELWDMYFQTDFGRNVPPATRATLRTFPFASLGIHVPTLDAAHEARLLVDRHAGLKRHSRDGEQG